MNRAVCLSVDRPSSAAGMQLQGGPTITAYPIGEWPAVGSTYWVQDLGNGSWIVMGGFSKSRQWNTYTPVWATSSGAPSLGNGSLTGRWIRDGNRVTFRILLSFGSTTSGGTGFFTFTIPFTGHSVPEQVIVAKAFTTGGFNWAGLGLIGASGTVVTPYFPNTSADNKLNPTQNSINPATVGTGVPQIGGNFTYTTNSNLWVGGTYECA